MALTARFTTPMQVVATPGMKEACLLVAEREGVSLASVYRDMITIGLHLDPGGRVLAARRDRDAAAE